MNVLVVDDDAAIADLLCTLLRTGGHDAFVATNGVDALKADGYDVMLLDLMMPGFSGLDVLAHLPRDHPPVIVVTARDKNDRMVKQARKAGAVDVIHKAFGVDDVLTALRRLKENA